MLNHKKLYRLCGEERLVARAGVSERIGTSAPMALPQGPDQRLSFDFVSGAWPAAGCFGCWLCSTTSLANALL